MAAAKKVKAGLQSLIGKRISLLDFDGEELNPTLVLILKSVDANWLEVELKDSGKSGYFNTEAVSFVTEHKEQP